MFPQFREIGKDDVTGVALVLVGCHVTFQFVSVTKKFREITSSSVLFLRDIVFIENYSVSVNFNFNLTASILMKYCIKIS